MSRISLFSYLNFRTIDLASLIKLPVDNILRHFGGRFGGESEQHGLVHVLRSVVGALAHVVEVSGSQWKSWRG